jgi:predicted O-methyltransferase YrrM
MCVLRAVINIIFVACAASTDVQPATPQSFRGYRLMQAELKQTQLHDKATQNLMQAAHMNMSSNDYTMFQATKAQLTSLLHEAWESGTMGAELQHPFISFDTWTKHANEGSIIWDRAKSFAGFIHQCKPKQMLEIGSFLGVSANFYLRVMTPWQGQLTSVDPNTRHRVFEHPRDFFKRMNEQFGNRVHTVDGFWAMPDGQDSGTWDYTHREPIYSEAKISEIMKSRPTISPSYFQQHLTKFDMAFIDGAHNKDAVLRDFDAIVKIMEPKSCVIFDDTAHWGGVKEALLDIEAKTKGGSGKVIWSGDTALFVDNGYFASKSL